ncbi:MAG: hypothetical protein IJ282_09920 [Lachnospiraceae bacterium]|nr:hypothetical protein [Lachnospiraceae bacterium]
MEDMTIVFFYVDAKKSGKLKIGRWKWGKEWQYDIRYEKKRLGDGTLKVIWVALPGREKDKDWTKAGVAQYLQHMPVPPEGRLVYYAPDKGAEKILGRGRENLNKEWILVLMEYYHVQFDSLVLIQDRELEAEELIRYFAQDIPYLGIISDFGYDWDEVEEGLAGEYGLVLDIQKEFRFLHIKGKQPLIVAGEKMEKVNIAHIPAGSVVISINGRRGGGNILQDEGKNIRYVDMERFLRETVLDTAHKIKYNNTR